MLQTQIILQYFYESVDGLVFWGCITLIWEVDAYVRCMLDFVFYLIYFSFLSSFKNFTIFLLKKKKRTKMQTWPFNFLQISFQFSNFAFVHFSPLNFNFIQLRSFHQLLLKNFENKNLGNIFQSLIDFFNLKNYKINHSI